jgi:hypothetical protein
VLWSDERFDIRGGFINDPDEENVPQAVRCVRRGHVLDVRENLLTRKARSGVLNA